MEKNSSSWLRERLNRPPPSQAAWTTEPKNHSTKQCDYSLHWSLCSSCFPAKNSPINCERNFSWESTFFLRICWIRVDSDNSGYGRQRYTFHIWSLCILIRLNSLWPHFIRALPNTARIGSGWGRGVRRLRSRVRVLPAAINFPARQPSVGCGAFQKK